MRKLKTGRTVKFCDNGNIWRYGFVQCMNEEIKIKKWKGKVQSPKNYMEIKEKELVLIQGQFMEFQVGFTDNNLGMLKPKTQFSWEELTNLNIDKGELAIKIGLKIFDCALPQNWLDNFVEISGLDYDKVRYSTFMTYPEGDHFGKIESAWEEVYKWL